MKIVRPSSMILQAERKIITPFLIQGLLGTTTDNGNGYGEIPPKVRFHYKNHKNGQIKKCSI